MTHHTLLLLSVVLPIACASLAWAVRVAALRNILVVAGCLGTATAGLGLVAMSARSPLPLTAALDAPWLGHLGLVLELEIGRASV